jgi:hypothetical protein
MDGRGGEQERGKSEEERRKLRLRGMDGWMGNECVGAFALYIHISSNWNELESLYATTKIFSMYERRSWYDSWIAYKI